MSVMKIPSKPAMFFSALTWLSKRSPLVKALFLELNLNLPTFEIAEVVGLVTVASTGV